MSTVTAATPRSLADDLRARSDDELTVLLSTRPDLATPVPADLSQLASRATTRASVVRALDRLDRFTLQVIDALAIAPEPATPAALHSLLGTSTAGIRDALTTLQTQALAWGSGQGIRLVRTVHEIIGPFPAGLGPPLEHALGHHQPARLNTIATDLGLAPPSQSAAAIAHAIAAQLPDLLDELTDEAIEALQSLSVGPPSGRVENARRQIDHASAQTPIDELLVRGLMVPTSDSTVVLPREIGLHLRGGILHPGIRVDPPLLAGALRVERTVDHVAGAGAFETVRRVEAMLEAWGQEPPSVLRAGGLGVRDLRRLSGLLNVNETDAGLLCELAYAAGLLARGGEADELWLPTPTYDSWRRGEPPSRWLSLATTWLSTSRTAGLIGGKDDRERPVSPLSGDLDRPLAAEIRRLVLNLLAELPPGTAPEPADVLDAVQWLRARRNGRLRDDLVPWTLREAEAIGVTGHGALASYVRPLLDGRPFEEALQAAGAALRLVLPEPLEQMLLQADLTAVAPGPLRPDLARELATMADVESHGGASVHRFTPESVRRALDVGRSAAELHDFLAKVSRTPVPQPLSYLIDDVARRHGLLRVGTASSFVRCDDPGLLAEIVANPPVALGLRQIAPTVAVSSLDALTLVDRLRDMGLAPAPESKDGSIVVIRTPSGRTRDRSAPAPVLAERQPPSAAVVAAAVRALRAGDRSATNRPPGDSPARLGRHTPAQTLAELQRALEHGTTVWIGYVDNHGITSERVVDPVQLEAGRLTAFDHRAGAIRSFAVHRISGAAPATSGTELGAT